MRPRWQRILVALAGPVMNVITALTIPLAGALMYGVPVSPAPVTLPTATLVQGQPLPPSGPGGDGSHWIGEERQWRGPDELPAPPAGDSGVLLFV